MAGKGTSTNMVFNAINKKFAITKVIIEDKEDKKIFLKRRIKKLGYTTVIGQILFQLIIVNMLHFLSEKRKKNIIEQHNLDASPIPNDKIIAVKSVNAAETIEILRNDKPDLIIINGTRIIAKRVLTSVNCKFMNIHAGITPKYRGVHGTYWALVNKDMANSGVTVHFVDAGIDTGNIICQSNIKHEATDNFVTYPLLQLAAGISMLQKSISDYFNNAIVIQNPVSESHLWYHPTIKEYIYNRIIKKVK